MSVHDEILEQPASAARLLREGQADVEQIADAIAGRLADRSVDHVVIAARGSSDHAALYAQYVFGIHLRFPVALATPSVLSVYGVEPRFDRSLVIGISQSGASPDIVGVIAAARRQGAPTIALTNDVGSDLATAAEHHLDLRAGPELAVAATKTYVGELLAVAMLAAVLEMRLGADADRVAELAAVPAALEAVLASEPEALEVAKRLAGRDRLIVVGRGYEYATAREFALKLKELARVSADPYSAADFLHGPLALVEPGYPVITIAPSGPTAPDLDALLARLGGLDVERIVVSDRSEALAAAELGIRLPTGIAEWLMPLVAIVPGQLLALHLAHVRGIDPEEPRWIHKVTLTN
jgi:glucosamine--fructose-6-phosphate aminotransferase (isomerizing)